jgi:hypothetical protein
MHPRVRVSPPNGRGRILCVVPRSAGGLIFPRHKWGRLPLSPLWWPCVDASPPRRRLPRCCEASDAGEATGKGRRGNRQVRMGWPASLSQHLLPSPRDVAPLPCSRSHLMAWGNIAAARRRGHYRSSSSRVSWQQVNRHLGISSFLSQRNLLNHPIHCTCAPVSSPLYHACVPPPLLRIPPAWRIPVNPA